MSRFLCVIVILFLSVVRWSTAQAGEFPAPPDTQKIDGQPLTPTDAALRGITLPAGFRASLFAAEPDVRQPIAMAFDPRGRLWVAENYTYAERQKNFDRSQHDRILVFSDTDNDGRFDQRSVFSDTTQLLTSIEVGFGGVFALCPPRLLFFPDANGDDQPDGPPQVLLDGFREEQARHTLANGLKWGPDGWLYGRHGILATSQVGVPGSPQAERVKLNCGIWRYHPTRRVFEVVAHGTTNPWGMDWDARGEAFFINTVIGHLWHLIPGAHYRRMYGDDLDPHVYGLIEQHADHVHWDTNENWDAIRKGSLSSSTLRAGGGHAHVGMMIYQGDNWPATYRGGLFTLNLHGRRVNAEVLERQGSGFVGRHGGDPIIFGDPWFRGIDLASGPDGGVFVLDWSDIGECHDDDGIHRNSGRIFKIAYGKAVPPKAFDLARNDGSDLVKSLTSPNNWFAKQARQVLQQRAAAGVELKGITAELRTLFSNGREIEHRLRALWTLYAIGAADEAWLVKQLGDNSEHVRTWALRLVTDPLPLRGNSTASASTTLTSASYTAIARAAKAERSPFVRLALAAALQRLPLTQCAGIAAPLLAQAEDATDHNLPLMLWYGIKDLAVTDPNALVALAAGCEIPLIRRFIARRLGEANDKAPAPLGALVQLSLGKDESFRADLVVGLSDALKGQRKAKRPIGWDSLLPLLAKSTDATLRDRVRDMNALFGDDQAVAESRRLALDSSAPVAQRSAALQTLIDNRPADLRVICEKLLDDRQLAVMAVRGLALFDAPAIADKLVRRYRNGFAPEVRPEVIAALVSRPTFARILLAQVGPGAEQIPRSDITAFHARQIRSFNDQVLTQKLTEVWGLLRDSSADKRHLIDQWTAKLTPHVLAKAETAQGRLVFSQTCAACHRLYGEGGVIGPDLTGGGRANLAFLLDNIGDPSAVVATDYRMAVVTLTDGRVLTGTIGARTARTITVQTMTDKAILERTDIADLKESNTSLMPEGLLQVLSEIQVRDLIAYLMTGEQVALPPK